jgi:ATP-dependent RNA helicase DeaD
MSFIELGLNEVLVEKLVSSGIKEPSDVQIQALPPLLAGKDGVLVSPTGTGKTLAYLLPLLQKIDGTRRETQAIVLAPTQELAMQIMREAEAYGQPLGIKATALIGGASLARQLERMKSKPALIVGTPGRVREVTTTRKLSLHNVIFAVVDETDRIFSLGGKSDVEILLRQCSRDRQTVFVSATRSEAMRDAEKKWQKEPWVSDFTEQANESGLSSTLQHWYFQSDRREKIDMIRKLVRHMKPSSALLFVNDTEKIGELLAKLRYEGFSVDALYGDTRGQERGEVMQRFRKGRTTLLIATDVAARGLDLPGLPLVIQYEPALDADHYVHRSGRTARMGRDGTSITLITPQERFIIDKLEKQLKIQVQPKMLYEGKVVSLEEGQTGDREGSERKPQLRASGGEVNDRRPAWKSKAEYMATLKPETGKPEQAKPQPAKLHPAKPRLQTDRKSTERKPSDKSQIQPAPGIAPKSPVKPPVKPAKVKADRERDRKNKGAPKWLKEKRETPSADNK